MDEHTSAAGLADEALAQAAYDLKLADLRALPQVQAILRAGDPVRRECILLLAGQDGARRNDRLLSVIARRKAGLSLDDIESVLPPVVTTYDPMDYPPDIEAGERLWPLLPQIEATWGTLDPAGRERLGARLRELADWILDQNIAHRLCALIEPEPVPAFDLLDTGDRVGQALRAALEASSEPAGAKLALVEVLAQFPVSIRGIWTTSRKRPYKKWYPAARAAGRSFGDPAGLGAGLLDAALTALGEPGRLERESEALLCALALFTGMIADTVPGAELLPRLRRLAVAVVPRSVRLGNVAVEAIASSATRASRSELERLRRDASDGNLRNAADRALRRLATPGGASGASRD